MPELCRLERLRAATPLEVGRPVPASYEPGTVLARRFVADAGFGLCSAARFERGDDAPPRRGWPLDSRSPAGSFTRST